MKVTKLIDFMVDGIENGNEYIWEVQAPDKESCKKHFENKGVKVIEIVTKKNHHICKYCGGIANGIDSNILCDDCCEVFGHRLYSEL